jgi:dipeptidyl-peptidase-4
MGTHIPSVSPDASKIAVLHSNDVTPMDLYIVDAKGGLPERRVTHSPPKEFDSYKWAQARYVTFKSHVDGVTVHGRVLEPPNLDRSKKYAAIMGPVYPNSVRNRWTDREEWRGSYNGLQQYLAVEGQYIVMLVDVRGSVGHGRAFRERLTDYGNIDIDDIQSGVEYLKTLGYVDPGRVGIWGSSYGGLMTLMSLFKKPGVYAAGVASSPASNIWHAQAGQESVVGQPDARPDAYKRSSAITYGEDLKDHLMIIHGMQDTSVLFKDSVTLAEKLMMLGKDFDLVLSPTSVHSWSRKDYVAVYFMNKLVGHFDRYLGRGPR